MSKKKKHAGKPGGGVESDIRGFLSTHGWKVIKKT